jgi:hypothetical protein
LLLQCTAITSLPTTITTQGIYCLTTDFSLNLLSGNAVTINVNNVTIDLNGHKIGNIAAGLGTTAQGFYAYQRANVTIKNGTIRGFLYGINLDGTYPLASQGHLVEDILADRNTCVGILVFGSDSVIRHNHVVATGGYGTDNDAHGIFVTGPGNRVIDNDIITVTPTGASIGFGIDFEGIDGIVAGNRITEAQLGIYMVDSSTKYRDNVTTDVTTPYTGGTDAGNNN